MTERYIDTICALVHGEPDAGKSWLGQTTPAPRLVIDAEGGSRHTRRALPDGRIVRVKKVEWDPTREGPPEVGDWECCQVFARDFNTVKRTYEWLNTGQHPFRSVVLDSLTEVQKRCKDVLSTGETLTERMWGDLLIQMELLIRQFRDLAFHPIKPIECTVILALTKEVGRQQKSKPAVQGAIGISLPGYVDLEGYLARSDNDDGTTDRRMLIHNHEQFEAKCRLHELTEVYGSVIVNPDFTAMLEVLNNTEEAA